MSTQQDPLLTALVLEGRSLEHREKVILSYAKKYLDDLPAGLEIQVKRDLDGQLRFEAHRIIKDKEYFCLYLYQNTEINIMKRMFSFLDKAIRQNNYPDGSFGPVDEIFEIKNN